MFRHGNGGPAPHADQRAHHRISGRAFRALRQGRGLMFQLIGLEIHNHCRQFWITVTNFGELFAIMAVNLGFDGNGARHGSLRPDGRRHRPQRKARNIPNWVQGRGADAAFGHHFVKGA